MNNSEKILKMLSSFIEAGLLTSEDLKKEIQTSLKFKKEMGRVPSITSSDPWEKRMAEGVAYLKRKIEEEIK